jgi:thiol-disulfide isomerase/thioredoxin
MVLRSCAQTPRKPVSLPGWPMKLRIKTDAIRSATTSSKAYSKTTCPESVPGLGFRNMDENEFGNSENSESGVDFEVRREAEPATQAGSRAEEGPRGPIPLWGKVAIMVVIVLLASIGYLRTHNQNAESAADIQEGPSDVPEPEKRKPVPDIMLTAGAGKNMKLSDFKGHVVLLSFWASWCTPCLVELPTFIDLHDKLAKDGLEIVPVNVDENTDSAQEISDFWKTKKFPFPTFFDPTHKGAEAFQVDSLPSNFILDKQGRLVAQGYGANDWSADTSINFIKQLLKEQ